MVWSPREIRRSIEVNGYYVWTEQYRCNSRNLPGHRSGHPPRAEKLSLEKISRRAWTRCKLYVNLTENNLRSGGFTVCELRENRVSSRIWPAVWPEPVFAIIGPLRVTFTELVGSESRNLLELNPPKCTESSMKTSIWVNLVNFGSITGYRRLWPV